MAAGGTPGCTCAGGLPPCEASAPTAAVAISARRSFDLRETANQRILFDVKRRLHGGSNRVKKATYARLSIDCAMRSNSSLRRVGRKGWAGSGGGKCCRILGGVQRTAAGPFCAFVAMHHAVSNQREDRSCPRREPHDPIADDSMRREKSAKRGRTAVVQVVRSRLRAGGTKVWEGGKQRLATQWAFRSGFGKAKSRIRRRRLSPLRGAISPISH
jgi:hypothetical protein